MELSLKTYKKEFEYSYAFGAFPAIELIKARPHEVLKVLVSSAYREDGSVNLLTLCSEKGIEVEYNDRLFNRLSPKENCFVIGVFSKYKSPVGENKPHVALVNPGNMGNLGTIIRTMLGFGVKDLAIIGGGADILDPKAVRASMGAMFRINFEYFNDIEDYMERCKNRDIFTFMLDGEFSLDKLPERPSERPFTLVFGNEATGLDNKYLKIGKSVVVRHSNEIDSLNLSIAVGISLYEFTKHAI
jgi:TrmH family RNA methyltransferase